MHPKSTHSLKLLLLAPLAACAQSAPPGAALPASCSPERLAQYTGQAATSALAARMLAETGKTALRWVRHGMMVTMEFRENRLTIFLDPAGRVDRASCS